MKFNLQFALTLEEQPGECMCALWFPAIASFPDDNVREECSCTVTARTWLLMSQMDLQHSGCLEHLPTWTTQNALREKYAKIDPSGSY